MTKVLDTRPGTPYVKAAVAVLAERHRQHAKWGTQRLDPRDWVLILQEEFGEFCQAFLQSRMDDMETELVQVAAVAHAMLEDCLESKWRDLRAVDVSTAAHAEATLPLCGDCGQLESRHTTSLGCPE